MSDKNKNLYYLDDLSKYKVASDDPDVRGWDVIDADDRRVGKVDRLLSNKETKRVVYLDVEVDRSLIEAGHEVYNKASGEGMHEFLNEEGEDHLIIPIGMVTLDEENKKVHSTEINHSTFSKTKRMKKGADVDREYELIVLTQYFPAREEDNVRPGDKDFYDREEFKRSEHKR
ncbi:MAG TPA: PRC-barrel domain-containing protein [Cryomorphaceae bacterium]|nr:PRC-barrel domain-containing protein [Cryomorphaceae bacterium]